MAITYRVYHNRDGFKFNEARGLSWDQAVLYAANLDFVSARSIKQRIARRAHSSGGYEVGRRSEQGASQGLWIEKEEFDDG